MERGEMPTSPFNILSAEAALIVVKAATLLILIFYALFSLIIVRQVSLMSKTLITGIAPVIRSFALIHAGFAIGLIILAWVIL